MDPLWKAAAAVLLAVILGLTIGKQEKDIAVLLTIGVCAMVSAVAVSYLAPVLDFLRELESLADMQSGMLGILIKAAGIALISELVGLISSDAGNASLAKAMQMLATCAILYLSIPIFRALLTLIQEILGEL